MNFVGGAAFGFLMAFLVMVMIVMSMAKSCTEKVEGPCTFVMKMEPSVVEAVEVIDEHLV